MAERFDRFKTPLWSKIIELRSLRGSYGADITKLQDQINSLKLATKRLDERLDKAKDEFKKRHSIGKPVMTRGVFLEDEE